MPAQNTSASPSLDQAVLPGPPPAPEPPSTPAPRVEPFTFHGTAGEFFRIWIVNTFLTLITGGIFLAWAKVRKRRYLRGSTEFMGHRFDYRADPRRILIGNVVVFIFFVGYAVIGAVYPIVAALVVLAGIGLLPWVVVRSLTFNAHNTTYRGMRFRFSGSLSAAVAVYLLRPLILPFTLGLSFPSWVRAQKSYLVNSHRLGDAYFRFEAPVGPFYAAYLWAGLAVFASALAAALIVALAELSPGSLARGLSPQYVSILVIYGIGFFFARQIIFARVFRLVWNHTRLDDHKFHCTLTLEQWMRIQLLNLPAIIFSCGLLYPWAVIRSQKHLASTLSIALAGPIERIEEIRGSKGNGVGESAAEFVGMDFGL
jgi:uncharacterized membrane protein YjgN (DUF898 family)